MQKKTKTHCFKSQIQLLITFDLDQEFTDWTLFCIILNNCSPLKEHELNINSTWTHKCITK